MWKSLDTERRQAGNRSKDDISKGPCHKPASALLGKEGLHRPAVHTGGTEAVVTAQRWAAGHTWGNVLWWEDHRKGKRKSWQLSQQTLPLQGHDLRLSPCRDLGRKPLSLSLHSQLWCWSQGCPSLGWLTPPSPVLAEACM